MNWLKNILKGFRGDPNDTRQGFLKIQERFLANDKQLHLAGAIVLTLAFFNLFIEMYNINKWVSVFITTIIVWAIGYLIELFQKYVQKKVLNHYDAAIMGIGSFVLSLLMALFITIRLVI